MKNVYEERRAERKKLALRVACIELSKAIASVGEAESKIIDATFPDCDAWLDKTHAIRVAIGNLVKELE